MAKRVAKKKIHLADNKLLPLLAISALVLLVFFISRNPNLLGKFTQKPEPTPTESEKTVANSKQEDLGNGFIRYTSYDFGFEINYPDYFELSEFPNRDIEQVSILHRVPGPNPQKEGGLQDGVMLKITYLPISGPPGYYTLPFEEIINKGEPAKKVNLSYHEAYTRNELIRMGGGQVYFIKKDDNNYFELWKFVQDPNKKGYQEITGQIVNSFRIID